jgi:hypothetical protein
MLGHVKCCPCGDVLREKLEEEVALLVVDLVDELDQLAVEVTSRLSQGEGDEKEAKGGRGEGGTSSRFSIVSPNNFCLLLPVAPLKRSRFAFVSSITLSLLVPPLGLLKTLGRRSSSD